MQILLVDDDPDSLSLIKLELELLGHRVSTAHDASSALETVLRDAPELLICDLRLPEVDGFELIRRMRQLPGLRAVPAIALSGLSSPGDMDEARRSGFDGHLLKPVDDGDLAAEIQRVAGRKAKSGGV